MKIDLTLLEDTFVVVIILTDVVVINAIVVALVVVSDHTLLSCRQ